MSRHRAQPPPRYRPHYGRFVVLGVSLATTAVALLGGVGVLPSAADGDSPAPESLVAADVANPVDDTVEGAAEDTVDETAEGTAGLAGSAEETGPQSVGPTGEPTDGAVGSGDGAPDEPDKPDEPEAPLPDRSGQGKRVVFSESEQRVWLVGSAGRVRDTYLVSGSLTDNLQPGTYQVYSRSEDAVGIDDSGTMKWFVRFTQGPTGAAIGFHTIPVDDGERVQTTAQLGTPQSHGCIRQATPDAKELWRFAPLGTTVVVV